MNKPDLKAIQEQAQQFLNNVEKGIAKINALPKDQREKLDETKKSVQEHLKLMRNEFGCK